uniref:protein YLS9-like n=1 Tax=Fragaria vesca subsp. vesca TaxID=101020 RepID=UPI0005CAFC4F|nr:PREDICTED: protein YLS9-like [Fragaria vesca subsp. vesca]
MGRTVRNQKNPTVDERGMCTDSDRQTNGWLRCCGITILVIFLISCIIGLPLWSQLVNFVINPRPGDIKIAVTGASLTDDDEFNNYTLDLNITLRNPYKPFRVYYDKALLVADYRDKAAMASIAGFHQPPKNTTFRTLVQTAAR